MPFLEDHGPTARVFYNNIIYITMLLLGSLICASLNAPEGGTDDVDGVARYTLCALNGATNTTTCPTANANALYQNLQIYNLSIGVIVLNLVLFLFSLVGHFSEKAMEMLFANQYIVSAINLGIFAGIVNWFNMSADLNEESNIDNSVYFKDFNPYTVAVFGLVAGIADLVVFYLLSKAVFKLQCEAPKADE